MLIKVKAVVSYGGHSMSPNGSVNLTFKAGYSELTNSIKMMQMLNCDVTVKVKLPDDGMKYRLGMFRIKDINVHGDGSSVIKLNGISDFIEMDNLNNMPLADAEVKEFVILASAKIEEEETEDIN